MDESHVTLPQVGGMCAEINHEKKVSLNTVSDYLYADNRPLKIPEFQKLVPQMVYVSATPGSVNFVTFVK